MIAAFSRAPASGIRIRTFLTVGAGVLTDCLTSFPRRACDRLFALNDAEASWRDWQSVKMRGGFGRRYRDPSFHPICTLDEVNYPANSTKIPRSLPRRPDEAAGRKTGPGA